MQWIYNKYGPDFDVGFTMTGQPRDGTGRKPRDKTLMRKGTFVNRPLGPVMGEVCPLELRITDYELRMKKRR